MTDITMPGKICLFSKTRDADAMTMLDSQLQAMGQLPENWDGYGAAAPGRDTVQLAREFVQLLQVLLNRRSEPAPELHVSPTRTAGVLIEWEDAATQHEVEIQADQSFSFLHLNKATGHIDTRKFSPGPQVVVHPGLLDELRQLLAA